MSVENIVVANERFDLNTLDVNKFMDVIRITSYIIQDTGLHQRGVRFDELQIKFIQKIFLKLQSWLIQMIEL